jgi:beta-1,4-N-acetylglucosaminyltransferase
MIPSSLSSVLWPAVAAAALLFARLLYILPILRRRGGVTAAPAPALSPPQRRPRVLAVLGSGGHTSELLSFLSGGTRTPVEGYFLVADTDAGSASKLEQSPKWRGSQLIRTPRARSVGEPLVSSFFSFVRAMAFTWRVVWRVRPDTVVCAGPGTCVPAVLCSFALRLLAIHDSRIVFVESYARVNSLSATGLLLYPIADLFAVQWPPVHKKWPNTLLCEKLL